MKRSILLGVVSNFVYSSPLLKTFTILIFFLVVGCNNSKRPNPQPKFTTFPEFWTLKLSKQKLKKILETNAADYERLYFELVIIDGKFNLIVQTGKKGRENFYHEELLEPEIIHDPNPTSDPLILSSLENNRAETINILNDFKQRGVSQIYFIPTVTPYGTKRQYLRYRISDGVNKVLTQPDPDDYYINPCPPYHNN
jgi:hypothetical protein